MMESIDPILIEKYRNDPIFHKVVDVLADALIRGTITPEELGQAITLAVEKSIEHKNQSIR